MSYLDYNIFYKTELPLNRSWSSRHWDIFVSAYNSSERVRQVFDRVSASRKYWLIHNEYDYQDDELPDGSLFVSPHDNEAPFVRGLVEQIESDIGAKLADVSLCIDITGFMRPHLLFLALYLQDQGIQCYDVLYSEPERYAKKERTTISEGSITVRQVAGFEGLNSPDQSDDFLIIGSGYDHRLIKAVAERKDKAGQYSVEYPVL